MALEPQFGMDERETMRWRESVAVSLAKIEAQMGRLVSDRESEKEAQLRVEEHLRQCDRESEARLQKQIDNDRVITIASIEAERNQRNADFAERDRTQRTLAARLYTLSGASSLALLLYEAFKK